MLQEMPVMSSGGGGGSVEVGYETLADNGTIEITMTSGMIIGMFSNNTNLLDILQVDNGTTNPIKNGYWATETYDTVNKKWTIVVSGMASAYFPIKFYYAKA